MAAGLALQSVDSNRVANRNELWSERYVRLAGGMGHFSTVIPPLTIRSGRRNAQVARFLDARWNESAGVRARGLSIARAAAGRFSSEKRATVPISGR